MRATTVAVIRRVSGYLFFVLLSVQSNVYAQAIASSTILWDTFKVEVNGADITNQISFFNPSSYISYSLNSGVPIFQTIPGWDVNLSASEIADSISATGDANSFTAEAVSSINGDTNNFFVRTGFFNAPIAGDYKFSIDYDLSAHTDTFNSDDNTIDVFAFPYAELQYVQDGVPNGSSPPGFSFAYNPDIEANNLDGKSVFQTGTIELFAVRSFTAGELIRIDGTVQSSSDSVFSGTVVTTPIPAALPLMIAGLLGLFGVAKRKSH
ncbi:MAG: hypothetical protein V3V50_01445 [Gammaproteobacteria bacterium]